MNDECIFQIQLCYHEGVDFEGSKLTLQTIAHCTHGKDDTHKTRRDSAFSVMQFNSHGHE